MNINGYNIIKLTKNNRIMDKNSIELSSVIMVKNQIKQLDF